MKYIKYGTGYIIELAAGIYYTDANENEYTYVKAQATLFDTEDAAMLFIIGEDNAAERDALTVDPYKALAEMQAANPFDTIDPAGDTQCAVYIPATIGNRPATEDERQSQISKAKNAMCEMYGGCTLTHGTGAWIDGNGVTVTEAVTIVYSYTTDATAHEKARTLYALAQEIAQDMAQDCVTTVYMGKPYFVEQ